VPKPQPAEFNELLKTKDLNQIQTWLKAQTWYGSSGDMEHLRRFLAYQLR
jgi:glycosyltransferase A (GT-A) superfamily protein (DUF2064 family)